MKVFRILAVDDDPHQLASLRRILRQSQFMVETAGSGKAALRMAMRNPPDLVLVDFSMPRMPGLEFLRRMRRLEAQGLIRRDDDASTDTVEPLPIPVIFLTAATAPHHVTGMDADAADYVTEPFDAEELRAHIRSQLRCARQQKQEMESIAALLRQ